MMMGTHWAVESHLVVAQVHRQRERHFMHHRARPCPTTVAVVVAAGVGRDGDEFQPQQGRVRALGQRLRVTA
jgi:hypothetical protein